MRAIATSGVAIGRDVINFVLALFHLGNIIGKCHRLCVCALLG